MDTALNLERRESESDCFDGCALSWLAGTTTKGCFHDVVSKTVMKDCLRKKCGGIFVIRGLNIQIYDAHSKAVINNRLRM